MRHRKRTDKLGKKSAHRKATLSNIVASLIKHERLNTKLRLARSARRYADKMITLAKKNTLHSRRQAIAFLRPDTDQEKENIRKLFDVLGPRFAERPGGYTRIIKLESRRGDNAPMAILEFVDAKVTFKERKKKEDADELVVDTEVAGDIQVQEEIKADDNQAEDNVQPAKDVEQSVETSSDDSDEEKSIDKDNDNNQEADKKSDDDSKTKEKKGGFFKKILKGGK